MSASPSQFDLVKRAFRTPGLAPRERIVFARLAIFMDSRGLAWPSLSRLTYDSGLARATVFKSLRALERKARITIEVQGRQHRPTVYRLHIPASPEYEDFNVETGASSSAASCTAAAPPSSSAASCTAEGDRTNVSAVQLQALAVQFAHSAVQERTPSGLPVQTGSPRRDLQRDHQEDHHLTVIPSKPENRKTEPPATRSEQDVLRDICKHTPPCRDRHGHNQRTELDRHADVVNQCGRCKTYQEHITRCEPHAMRARRRAWVREEARQRAAM